MTSRSAPACNRPRAWTLPAPLLLSLLVQLSPTLAQAQQPETVDLEWAAPEECPRLEEVQAGIRKLAGPRKSSAVPLRAEATITRTDEGELRLRLRLHAGEMVEERLIEARSCSALAGATAVAVALLFRSGALQSEDDQGALPPTGGTGGQREVNGEPSKVGGQKPPVPRSTPVAVTPEPDAKSHSPRRWHALAQVPLGLFGLGPLRGAPGFAGGVAVGASIDRWRFLARGALWLPAHEATPADFQPYGAETRRTSVTLSACRAVFLSRLELAPCATLSLQHLVARGEGAHIAAHTAQTTWAALGLGAQARLQVAPWLSLFLGIEGEVETSRPQLILDGVGPVETLLPAAATISAGPEWIF